MWAILDTDNETVLGVIFSDTDSEKQKEIAEGKTLILMTPENSPAYTSGKYIDGKFYPPHYPLRETLKEILNV